MMGQINVFTDSYPYGYCTICCNNIYSSHKPNLVSYSCLTDFLYSTIWTILSNQYRPQVQLETLNSCNYISHQKIRKITSIKHCTNYNVIRVSFSGGICPLAIVLPTLGLCLPICTLQ